MIIKLTTITLLGIANVIAGELPMPPTRQVHLDFHTSEHIPNIGQRFNKKQFQAAIQAGHLNQINIFAKCHHSWSYYPTKVGRMHPNLKFDLLGAQIEACHEIDVKCPIYYTVGWSANDAETHPEWCARNENGGTQPEFKKDIKPTDTKPTGGWKRLCAAAGGPYHAMILRQIEEICGKYDVDGFWFDIYHVSDHCYCDSCRTRMQKENVDLGDKQAVNRSSALALKEHMRQLRELIARSHPKATVYFNSATHISEKPIFTERLYDLNTQQELEDLPTTWGGYDKLPVEAKFHLGQGSNVVAMSGKFHKSWGEFGGFKHPDALKYEASAMIANGAACNFGDQLHPSGEMDIETYRNIGEAYQYVEKIEDYGPGGVPFSKLGLWLSLNKDADQGLVTMLLETHRDFVVANEKNLGNLTTLVIPSQPCLTETQAKILSAWVKKGGKLIVLGAGALDAKQSHFVIDVGADYLGASEYDFDYTVVKSDIGSGIVTTPFLNYKSGIHTKPTTGKALALIREPYFNRTYGHYSSHANTPYQLENSTFPAVLRNDNVIFFTHALDQLYNANGVRLHRDLFRNALDLLDPAPTLKVTNLPSSGRVSLLRQNAKNRYVAHLLYSPPLQRGDCKVIEDFPPIPGVILELRVPEKITKVRAIPAEETLRFSRDNGVLKVSVPTFTMHTAIVLEY